MKNKIKNAFKKAGIATVAFIAGLVVFIGALSVYAAWDTNKTNDSGDLLDANEWNAMATQIKSWVRSGENVSLGTTGNVGLGVASPVRTLDIAETVGNAEIHIKTTGTVNNNSWGMYHDKVSEELRFWDSQGSGDGNMLSLSSKGALKMQALSAAPSTCGVNEKGSLAATIGTTPMCMCNGSDWVSFAHDSVACDWDGTNPMAPPGNLSTDGITVFVTSEQFRGNLLGLAGANTKCQQAAENAGITDRSWSALLSEYGYSMINQIPINLPLYNTRGELVYSNFRSSITQNTLAPILNEHGNGQSLRVWIGDPDVSDAFFHCGKYWDESTSGYNGHTISSAIAQPFNQNNDTSTQCLEYNSLYCISF